MIINTKGILTRHNDDMKFFTSSFDNENGEETKELAVIKYFESTYILIYYIDKFYLSNQLSSNLPINNQTLTDLQEKIWHVVKSNNQNTTMLNSNKSYSSNFVYELKKNDIIKLGRIKFVVKEMNIVDGNYSVTKEIFKPFQEIE